MSTDKSNELYNVHMHYKHTSSRSVYKRLTKGNRVPPCGKKSAFGGSDLISSSFVSASEQ